MKIVHTITQGISLSAMSQEEFREEYGCDKYAIPGI